MHFSLLLRQEPEQTGMLPGGYEIRGLRSYQASWILTDSASSMASYTTRSSQQRLQS